MLGKNANWFSSKKVLKLLMKAGGITSVALFLIDPDTAHALQEKIFLFNNTLRGRLL